MKIVISDALKVIAQKVGQIMFMTDKGRPLPLEELSQTLAEGENLVSVARSLNSNDEVTYAESYNVNCTQSNDVLTINLGDAIAANKYLSFKVSQIDVIVSSSDGSPYLFLVSTLDNGYNCYYSYDQIFNGGVAINDTIFAQEYVPSNPTETSRTSFIRNVSK
ncbi:hypothetical protein AGMMS49592_0550 [Endomicrobiia bacterium]|nr:hypothetical protein AGMMS49592_0550 [Endomicrobiia bacterium]